MAGQLQPVSYSVSQTISYSVSQSALAAAQLHKIGNEGESGERFQFRRAKPRERESDSVAVAQDLNYTFII